MLTDDEMTRIRESWRTVEPMANAFPELLFRRLFEARPELQRLFQSNLEAHQARFLGMLNRILAALQSETDVRREVPQEEDAFLLLLALGRRHTELYGVPPDAWAAFGDAWVGALNDLMGPGFSPPIRAAWGKLFDIMVTSMQLGASSQVDLELGKAT